MSNHTHPTLTVDLSAIVANYRFIAAQTKPAEVAAVVKADGYGLGALPVSRALAAAGCKTFFVAHVEEGAALRRAIPGTIVFVLHGYAAAHKHAFAEHALSPVLSSAGQLSDWLQSGLRTPYALHLDTGMSRLGLSHADLDAIDAATAPALVMSHLASADDPEHEKNQAQLARFKTLSQRFQNTPLSLAASGGCFLGPDFAFDLVRPGIALYGGNPGKTGENPMRGTVTLSAPLLQVRSIDRGDTVGYGATYAATGPRRLGIAAMGYADGLLRAASNRGHGVIGGVKCPIIGRVSMDLVTLDVSAVPEHDAHAGAAVEFIGPHQTVDALAREAGTLPYEIYTRLGPRIERRYTGGEA
ncbi:MAG: alanine racemase [Alphaproteobacteria bacterium]|nr:alanine racemase [Alphaproteobacteria bacterium]